MGEVQSFSELPEHRKQITEPVEFLKSALRSRLLGLSSWMKKYKAELKEIVTKSLKKNHLRRRYKRYIRFMSLGFLA